MAENKSAGKGLSVPKNPAMALRALNARHALEADADPVAEENTTILQTNNPTNNPTKILTDQPTNQLTDKPTATQSRSRLPAAARTASKEAREAPSVPVAAPETVRPPARVDGRTLRVRQDTLDRTMVTSMRLAVSTIEQLDEFCWRYRRRKQDVVQEALELYFQAVAEEEGEG